MPISDFLTPEQLEIMLNQTYGNQQTQDFIRPNPLQFQYPFIPGGIMNTGSVMYDEFPPDFSFRPQGLSQQFKFLPEAYNQSEDVEQVDSLTGEKKFNVLDLLSNFIPGRGIGSFLAGILPKDPPEVKRVKDFYARNFGVTSGGSVGSGIMEGYNPVSGGFLNYLTSGKYGEPMQVGLGRAMQKRIEDILGRKMPQTDASRARVQELRDLQLQEMRDRAEGGESLGSIGKSTFTGKGGAFEKRSGGFSGIKGTPTERNYGGR
jgi:hypothetical protein